MGLSGACGGTKYMPAAHLHCLLAGGEHHRGKEIAVEEREKIEAWIQKMYWLTQLPEDDYKKLRRIAMEGRNSFGDKFEELHRKYGKK